MISRDLPGTLPGTIFGTFQLICVIIIDNFRIFFITFAPFAIIFNRRSQGKHKRKVKGKYNGKRTAERKIKGGGRKEKEKEH